VKLPTIALRPRGLPPLRFAVRPGTSDEKAIEETVTRDTYRKRGVLVEPGEPWVDLGANVGGFSVLVGAAGGRLVAAVEAEAENAALTAANLRLNGMDDSIVRCAAVVPDDYPDSEVGLHVNAKPLQRRRHSILKDRRGSVLRLVPAVRFSDVADERAVKMNIEGAEIGVLQALRAPCATKLAVEWSFDVEPRTQVLAEVVEKLRRWYARVELSRKIDPVTTPVWRWFPPNVFLYATGRR
jgi:FkbM family methyltransferase